MKKKLESILKNTPRRIVATLDLERELSQNRGFSGPVDWSYESFAGALGKLVEEGVVAPVKNAGYNGRIPPLAVRYRLLAQPVEPPAELFRFRSPMDLSYFTRKPQEFYRYHDILAAIDRYLVTVGRKEPLIWDTLNERSFQLTGDEKFLASAQGAALLRRVRLSPAALHCYPVAEPFFYRLLDEQRDPQVQINVLVIENKDSFSTFCRLLESDLLSLEPPIDLLVYGEGNKICGSWPFFGEIPGLAGKEVRVYYYGDLDPMGLIILRRWQEALRRAENEGGDDLAGALTILPAQGLYASLLQQGRYRELKGEEPPPAGYLEPLWAQFRPELRRAIENLWAAGRMMPQEALSASRLAVLKEASL